MPNERLDIAAVIRDPLRRDRRTLDGRRQGRQCRAVERAYEARELVPNLHNAAVALATRRDEPRAHVGELGSRATRAVAPANSAVEDPRTLTRAAVRIAHALATRGAHPT